MRSPQMTKGKELSLLHWLFYNLEWFHSAYEEGNAEDINKSEKLWEIRMEGYWVKSEWDGCDFYLYFTHKFPSWLKLNDCKNQ